MEQLGELGGAELETSELGENGLREINAAFEFLLPHQMPEALRNSEHRTHRVKALRQNRWACEDCGQFLKVMSRGVINRRKLLRY